MTPRPMPTATKKKVVAPLTSGPSFGAITKAIIAKRMGNINFFIMVVTSFLMRYIFSGLDIKIDNQMVIYMELMSQKKITIWLSTLIV
jgi:hypothetical protein